jgi:hypothetical protein
MVSPSATPAAARVVTVMRAISRVLAVAEMTDGVSAMGKARAPTIS